MVKRSKSQKAKEKFNTIFKRNNVSGSKPKSKASTNPDRKLPEK